MKVPSSIGTMAELKKFGACWGLGSTSISPCLGWSGGSWRVMKSPGARQVGEVTLTSHCLVSSWSRARTVGDEARTVVLGPRLIVPLDILKMISFSILN